MNYDAIAIGAGLSGCSAAIQLAKLGYRILLLEQSHYPMHKLCGEFLSVEVTAAFEHLGIMEQVRKVGAQPIHRAYLTTAGGVSFRSNLPSTALGLSRYQLDFDRSTTPRSRRLAAAARRTERFPLRRRFAITA